MSDNSMKAAQEAQQLAAELQRQMQEKLMSGELDPAKMASQYMNAMADMMPDLSELQSMAGFDPASMMAGGFPGFDDDDDDDDTDYNDPNNLMQLCDYIAQSMDVVAQILSAPAVSVAADDGKWLQMGILCSGILSNLNGHSLDGLYIEEPNDDDYMEQVTECLEQAWGIESCAELHDMLTRLSKEGHRARYAALCNASSARALVDVGMDSEEQEGISRGFLFAKRFGDSKPAEAMLGWDLGRAALLVRFGLYLGWLAEGEASAMLINIAKTLSSAYNSWNEFGNAYQFGAAFWKVMGDPCSTKENNESIADAISELLTTDMLGTVGEWRTFAWLSIK